MLLQQDRIHQEQEADGLLDMLRSRRGQRIGVDEDADDALAMLLSAGVPAAHPRPAEVRQEDTERTRTKRRRPNRRRPLRTPRPTSFQTLPGPRNQPLRQTPRRKSMP